MNKYHVSRAAVLVFAAMVFTGFTPGLRAQTPPSQCNQMAAQAAFQQHDNYSALKDLEGCFQVPTSTLTEMVGTFDPITGTFAYSQQVNQKQFLIPLGNPVVLNRQPGQQVVVSGGNAANPSATEVSHLVGLLPANAVNVNLSFKSANGIPIKVSAIQLPFSSWGTTEVTCQTNVAGCPWPQTAIQSNWSSAGTTATLNAGQASTVEFTVQAGTKSFTGFLLIVRPPVIGLGAFTVPAIPLTIIYAPPLGVQRKNSNSYSVTTTTGTVLNMSIAQDNSTTQPTGDFTNSMTDVTNLSNIVSKIPVVAEYAKPYADVIGLVNQFMGSMSANITQGATLTQNHSLGVMYQVQNAWTTGDLVGGPGLEDLFVFLKDAQLMWVTYNGRLSVHLIKATLDMKAAHYFLENKDNPAGFDGLDSKTIKSMLALDPFTAPYVNYPYSPAMATPNGLMARSIPSRWVDLGQDDMGDSDVNPYSPTNSYTLTQTDQTTNTNYSTDVFDAKAGIVAGLNPSGPDNPQNVTQTQTTKTTVTFGVSTAESSSQTSAASAKFYFAQNENLVAEAYYDVVFGTFAFVPQPSSPQATYTAVAVNAYGQPLAHQTVVLQIGGRKYMALTNAQGRYSFHSLNIAPGSLGTLFAGGVSRQIQIGAPTARLIPGTIPIQRPPQ